jgi:hypothetical protein
MGATMLAGRGTAPRIISLTNSRFRIVMSLCGINLRCKTRGYHTGCEFAPITWKKLQLTGVGDGD